ncbi:MAG: dephospho-CoA kinase [Verrucomicrobia bacterium]|nr:dephospho-CoA kinase [Verrucomicrobiota bacterium]
MPVLGITGGVACGKTTFVAELREHFTKATWFCADTEVERLTSEDTEVRESIAKLFGMDAFKGDGTYNREHVRKLIFADSSQRQRLNEILHPKVRENWLRLANSHRAADCWLFLEIPLLYETGSEVHCDRVIAVGCTPETQMQRLTTLRGLPRDLAEQIRATQWNLQEKSNRADHLIWNDCPSLKRQTAACAAWLINHYARVRTPSGA